MATLPIHLEVEDVAVGPVMLLLKRTPGIIKMMLDLGDDKPPQKSARTGGKTTEQIIIEMFVNANGGPLSLADVQAVVGGAKSRSYGALHALKKKGVIQGNGAKGHYQMTAKAMRMMEKNSPLALPAPAHTKKNKLNGAAHSAGHGGAGKTINATAKTKSGRAPQGSGPAALRELLTTSPMTPTEIRTALGEKGVSVKSTSGIIDRAKRDKLIKKVGDKYELTAKGAKVDNKIEETTVTGA
jgi:DNA-binding PadR family transcriptional regulator